jgi:hypothetical protein
LPPPPLTKALEPPLIVANTLAITYTLIATRVIHVSHAQIERTIIEQPNNNRNVINNNNDDDDDDDDDDNINSNDGK